MSVMKTIDTDYFIIGSGVAGLMSALHLAGHGRVLIATKKKRADSNTNFAQGGIACVMKSDDSITEHVRDTVEAGAGLCNEKIVREILSAGPAGISELEKFGIDFTERDEDEGGGYDLGKEGGHSKRRVLHFGDTTGRRVEEVLLDRVQAEKSVSVMEHWMAIDVITECWIENRTALEASGPVKLREEDRCVGAYVLDRRSGEILAVRAPYVILATGGGGKVYLYTSNPDIATGDGVAMGWRAGLTIENMEFIQFHPTCLYHSKAKSFLISEALRGEGAKLVDREGNPFADKYDDRGELAPRDIVARAIDSEMKATGAACVYLDIRHKSREFLAERFPNIYKTCLEYGFDMALDLIPVVPAAHYFCGGIKAGVDGTTELKGLLACGEVACTGLHGANRLASNSLLEALVCSRIMADRLAGMELPDDFQRPRIPDWEYGAAVPSDEAIVVEHNWNELRTCMWDYVGIVRSNKRLERAARRIRNLRSEIRQYYLDYLVTADILELRNIAAVGELIVRSALARHESRGLHYTLDYPTARADTEPRNTVVRDVAGGPL